MEEYKPNSHKSKEEQKDLVPEKRVEKVISGTVKPKKKSEMQKFADVFISEDVNNVKSYIVMDVLVPAIKKAIYEVCAARADRCSNCSVLLRDGFEADTDNQG